MSRFDLGALRSRDELQAVGKELAAEISDDDVPVLAAAVSFKIVLALFPALFAVVAIYAQTLPTDASDLQRLLTRLPPELTTLIEERLADFIDQLASGGIAFAGIAGGLWAASGAAATLNTALSRAYDEPEDRKLVGKRATALVVTVALLVALIAISVLLVAGGTIEDAVLERLPLTETARLTVDVVSTGGRYLLAILLLMVLFAFIYWIGPDYERRPGYRWITPGAFVAVLVWLLASAAFGWYVSRFGSYTDADSPYGPLGSAIVFMLWLQLSMFALLLGAEINQVLVVRARERASSAGSPVAASTGGDRDAVPSDVASVTPVASRAGAHIRFPDDKQGDGSGRPPRGRDAGAASDLVAAATTTRGAHRDRSEEGAEPAGSPRAVAVHDHDVAARATRADGAVVAGGHSGAHGPADGRRVPMPTLVGAAVATVSSLVGLAGLLRRLKGD